MSPLLVEVNLRLTYSIGLIAGLAFLGFAPNPNGADWGFMIQENRLALVSQPWGVVLPVVAIALLTIGTGLVGDGIARAAVGIDREGRRVSTPPPPRRPRGHRPSRRAARHGRRHRRRRLVLDPARARCSASSASRARARRRPGWPCSATPAAAPDLGRLGPRRRPRRAAARADASAAASAAASSPTCRRIRPRRSTRRFGSAPSSWRCSRPTASARARASGATGSPR